MKKYFSFAFILAVLLPLRCVAAAGEAPSYWCASGVEAYGTQISIEDYCEAAACTADALFSMEVNGKNDSKAVMNGNGYPLTPAEDETANYLISYSGETYRIEPYEEGTLKVRLTEDITVVLSPTAEMPEALQENVWEKSMAAVELTHSVMDEIQDAQEAEKTEAFRQSVTLPPVEFTAEETAAMSNFMLHGRYYFDGETFFGMTLEAENAYPDFVRAEIFYDVETPKTGNLNLIDDHVNANYLTPYGNDLYYVCHDRDAGRAYLARLNRTTLAVEKLTVPADNAGFLQLREEKLWFTDSQYRFCTCDLNGKNRETVLDKAVYSPYFIADDWLVYQSGEDLTLHVFRLSDGTDLALTDMPACNPVISGHTMFFLTQEGSGNKGRLGCIDLSTPLHGGDLGYEVILSTQYIGEEFSIYNGVIYGCNDTGVSVANWQKLANNAWNGVTQRLYYMNDTYSVTASAVRDDNNEKDLITVIYLGNHYGYSSAFKRIH